MKVRLKFSKSGSMKFIGHLDVMRFFQKVFRRAGIDVSYSKGYSPHQVLSFASPLGVGLTSEGEYLDMQLESLEDPEHFIEQLNQASNEEIKILEYAILEESSKNAMSIVMAADYMLSLKDGYEEIPDYWKKFTDYMNQDQLLVHKKSKKGIKEVDIKPLVYTYASTKKDFIQQTKQNKIDLSAADIYHNHQILFLRVTCGSEKNLKPELVLEGFYHFLGKEWNPYAYQIHRIEVYTKLEDQPMLIPLIEAI